MLKALESMGVAKELVDMAAALYRDTKLIVEIDGVSSERGEQETGIR